MLWSTLFVAASSIAAVSADTPYRPGVAPSPFPQQAEDARVKIDPDTACDFADDPTKPRNVQLAAWMECQVLGFYPYPRTADPNNTDWLTTFDAVMHPTLRASFNGTKFDHTGFRSIFITLSSIIGRNYGTENGTGFQTWRDYYISSPDSDPKSKGGLLVATGFNGGVPKGQDKAFNAPNGAFWVVEDIDGQRWITEQREISTLPSANQLPKGGSWEGCANQQV